MNVPLSRRILYQLAALFSTLVVLGGMLLPPAPPAYAAPSTTIVISGFRTRGPAGGNDEFVELFNKSASPVNVGGWKINASNNAGTIGTRVTITTGTTLQPGQYYLATNSAAGGYSGSVPGNQTYATGFTDDGGMAILTDTNVIVDQVGMSSGSAYKEGTTLSQTASNLNQEQRRTDRCVDTDNNAADFTYNGSSSNPHNASSTAQPCGGPTNPSVTGAANPASVAQGSSTLLTGTVTAGTGPASTGLAVTGDLTAIGGAAGTVFHDDGLNGDATAGDNIFSFSATVTAGTSTGQKMLPISVTDAQSRSGNGTIALTVTSTATTRIREIQGASQRSTLAGQQVVNVPGVVTARTSNGFYLQDEDPNSGPGSPQASSGIFVFTSSAPAASIQVGERVSVSATVSEFIPSTTSSCNPSAFNLPLTELTFATVAETNQIVALPAPVVVGAGGRVPPKTVIDDDSPTRIDVAGTPPQGTYDPDGDGIDFWESLEGMRVQINDAHVVGPTNSFNEIPVVPDNGAGFGLMTPRGGIKVRPNDFNPERIFLDDGIQGGPTSPDVNVGTTFTGATIGQVDYSFCNFHMLVSQLGTPTGGVTREVSNLTGGERLTMGSFNVENLTTADPNSKYTGLAETIVSRMGAPDVLTIEEIQDNNGTPTGVVASNQVWDKLISFIQQQPGGPTYTYRQIDPEADQDGGAPSGNIRVGLLFRTDRGLQFVPRTSGGLDCSVASPTPAACATTATAVQNVGGKPQLTLSPGRILDPSPAGPNNAFNASRKPLVAEFVYHNRPLFMIANHFNSKGGDEPLFGRFQPQDRVSEVQRHKQATLVNGFVRDILAVDSQAAVILGGDFNDFEFSETMNILRTGSIDGGGSAELVNLYDLLPENERYSYVFEGNSQTLDHILVSPAVFSGASPEYDIVHTNAEFFDQQSDHDPQVARFNIGVVDTTAPVSTATTVPAAPNGQNGWFTSDVSVTLSATDSGGAGVKEIVYSATGAQVIAQTTVPGATATFSITTEGTTTISFFARDNATNAETPAKTLEIKLDKTAPTTTGTTTPSQNGQQVTVSLSATDPASGAGVKEIVYSATGAQPIAETTVPGSTASFQVTTAGNTTVSFFARDNAGNIETPAKTLTVGAASGNPEASLTPDLVDFGDVPISPTTPPTRTVVVTNTGLTPLTVTAITLDGAQASEFAVVSPSTPFTVSAGGNQPIVVRFTPTSKGPKTARLALADNAPGQHRVTLRGTGQGPEAAIAPDRVGFGRVQVNTVATPRSVTIFNTGLAPLTVSAVTVTGADVAAFPLSGLPPLPATIPAGEEKSFTVGFTPTQKKGYSARIEVTHNGTGELRVPLSGQGVLANEGGGSQPSPEANLSPNLVSFGDAPIGTAVGPRTVMIFNTGDAPLVVNSIVLDGAQAGEFSFSTAPVTLPHTIAVGDNLPVEVRFTPTARGQRTATLRVADNANGPEQKTTLRGVGQGPEAAITPNAINFGQLAVGTSQARGAVVTNTGLAALHITSVAITGAAASDFQVTPAGPATVQAGDTLPLTVTCTPSAVGNRTARLEVNDDATGERRVNLTCRGT